jgi:hypothetical protein
MNNLDALKGLECKFCDGTMVKVSDKGGVVTFRCNKNESHVRTRRKAKPTRK